jgi:hypothetical protein
MGRLALEQLERARPLALLKVLLDHLTGAWRGTWTPCCTIGLRVGLVRGKGRRGGGGGGRGGIGNFFPARAEARAQEITRL